MVFLLAYFPCLNRVYSIDFPAIRSGAGILCLKFILLPFIFCSCRLVLRRHYCLAIRICDYLKIPKGEGASRILGHWACYKVSMISGYWLAVTYMYGNLLKLVMVNYGCGSKHNNWGWVSGGCFMC